MNRLITLTTDFGRDYYAAEMKGIILSINPDARIVDVPHDVRRHSVLEGAFVLSQIRKYFPKGTVHVGVVDPGVGSKRKALAVETKDCFFVGPDNGLFSLALKDIPTERIVELDAGVIRKMTGGVPSNVSQTFHGRDMFAPAAALISKGVDLNDLGRRIAKIKEIQFAENKIIYIDSFGNIITSVPEDFNSGDKVVVEYGRKRIKAFFRETFSDVPAGDFVVLKGSNGFIELDVNQGNAGEKLNAKVGDRIRIRKKR